MDNGKRKVVMAQMKPRERHEWTAKTPHRRRFKWDKRLLRRSVPLAAVFLCIGAAAVTTALFGGDVQAVMSHVTAGFGYYETLGRPQFVSNILPARAMVFFERGDDSQKCALILPTETKLLQAWSADEPWVENEGYGQMR